MQNQSESHQLISANGYCSGDRFGQSEEIEFSLRSYIWPVKVEKICWLSLRLAEHQNCQIKKVCVERDYVMKIAFLGMGIMGRAMAGNLLAAGHELIIWNRTVTRCKDLEEKGAAIADTPAAAVAAADMTIAMLADPDAALDVALGENGVLESIVAGKSYVDMSTVDPQTAELIGVEIEAAGGRFLEAPVSGSKKPAEDGSLVILAAGDQTLYEEVTELFDILGKRHLYLGDVGQGAAMKILVNMTMGGMMTLLCEALALGKRCDLKTEQILEVFAAGAIANPLFALKGPLIAADEHSVNFPLKHMQKDLRLAVALGDNKRQPLPAVSTANEQFKRALAEDCGELDFSAVGRSIGVCDKG
jgi:3-hydroxyisobutyrate dehydrogenase-like beta-hydroxyacid dehydrogenase